MGNLIDNMFNCGIMQLVGRKLRDDLSNTVTKEMDNLREYLYKSAQASLSIIEQGIKKISKDVAAKTDTLADFAKFTGSVQ